MLYVMASPNDSSLTFFRKASPVQFAWVLDLYPRVLHLKAVQARGAKKNGPQEFIKLDVW